MPPEDFPAGTPATGATGQQPGATQPGPTSQGPNDPINPPATGGNQQPATGAAADQGTPEDQRRATNQSEALARMARERDEAREALEAERRKGLTPEEVARLRTLDEQVKAQAAREKNLILRYEIAARAPKLGIVDPEIAVLLLEKSNKITVDDTGAVTGLDEALKDLIKEKPHLVKATTQGVDAGAGGNGPRPGGKGPGMNDIIRGAARGRSISAD